MRKYVLPKPIFKNLTNSKRHYVHVLLYLISPNADNNCLPLGYKFIYTQK